MSAPRILLAATLLVAGCASYDGRGLVPGQSRAAEVEALMGTPADKVALSAGESVWFYPRQPFGRRMLAVRLGPDGVVRGVEQRLTPENVRKLVPGTTQAKDVRELLGPPWRVARLERQHRDVWEYAIYDLRGFEYVLYVQLSGEGVVREVLMLRDLYFEPGSDSRS